MKNVTITLDEEVLRRTRVRAAQKGVSVSKYMAQLLERESASTEQYQRAFREWKRISDRGLDIDAPGRLNREQAHERRG